LRHPERESGKKDWGCGNDYGYVYVAQVAMGASQAQFLKAVREAEALQRGPSLILTRLLSLYNHGNRKTGWALPRNRRKLARGLRLLAHLPYRFNPLLEQEGKNPLPAGLQRA
jgi:pyruvate-ferredoxin/flavodoxin oxidoreductase